MFHVKLLLADGILFFALTLLAGCWLPRYYATENNVSDFCCIFRWNTQNNLYGNCVVDTSKMNSNSVSGKKNADTTKRTLCVYDHKIIIIIWSKRWTDNQKREQEEEKTMRKWTGIFCRSIAWCSTATGNFPNSCLYYFHPIGWVYSIQERQRNIYIINIISLLSYF